MVNTWTSRLASPDWVKVIRILSLALNNGALLTNQHMVLMTTRMVDNILEKKLAMEDPKTKVVGLSGSMAIQHIIRLFHGCHPSV